MASTARSELQRITIEQCMTSKTPVPSLITVDEDTALHAFLKTLSAARILSAPIYRSVDSKKVLVGLISIADVLAFLFRHELFDTRNPAALAQNDKIFETTVKMLMQEMGPVESPVVFAHAQPLSDAITLFTASKHHRALAVQVDLWIETQAGIAPVSESVSMMSQQDVGLFLYKQSLQSSQISSSPFASFAASVFSQPLNVVLEKKKDLMPPVISITDFQPILAAFNIMHLSNIHAVPVLNASGELVGSVSESALEGFDLDSMEQYTLAPFNCYETEQLSCGVAESVEEAVVKMLANRAHHVWVIGDEGHVIVGVVTWTDVLQLFAE